MLRLSLFQNRNLNVFLVMYDLYFSTKRQNFFATKKVRKMNEK